MSEIIKENSLVEHPVYGKGRVAECYMQDERMVCDVTFFERGPQTIPASSLTVTEANTEESGEGAAGSYTIDDLKYIVREALAEMKETPLIPLAEKWEGGEIIIKPGKPGLQDKVLPIDDFFHKIVMIRDRLRVLEQNINSHPKLDDSDKIALQQYITRIYGSLTSFNILFKEEDDRFIGQSRKRG
jgi:hypothetical protein